MTFLIILMILLGIAMGYILFNYYKKSIQKYHGPNSNTVRKTIHKYENGKCYMFEPHVYVCPIY